jgi:hypothetical protein
MAGFDDRQVHGYTTDGAAIVRYDRAGKWWVEPEGGKRRPVKLDEAAALAAAGRALLNRYGGTRFDATVRALRGSNV